MILNDDGVKFIIGNEGIRYKAYLDTRGYYTIGIGHLIKNNETILKYKVLSYKEVLELFAEDNKPIESYVNNITNKWDNVSQNQFNALCDFCFQYGTNLARKYPYTYSAFLSGDINKICDSLMNFTSVSVKNGDELLLERRKKEIKLLRS